MSQEAEKPCPHGRDHAAFCPHCLGLNSAPVVDQQYKIKELKKQANEKYEQIKTSMQYYQDLSREYVQLLKQIEDLISQPRF